MAVQRGKVAVIKDIVSYRLRSISLDGQQVADLCSAIRFSSSDALQDWLVSNIKVVRVALLICL
jgi:hypothetical protein